MRIKTEKKRGFSSSKILAVMGKNRYRTAYEQWLVDTKQVEQELSETAKQKTEMGHLMEPVIKQAVEAKIGKELTLDKNKYMHDKYDFLTIEFDALDHEEGIVYEFKNTVHDEDFIIEMYYPQVQSAMAISGYNLARICFLKDGWKLGMIDVPRDENFIEHMIYVGEYYITCVEEVTPPDEEYIASLVEKIEFFKEEETDPLEEIGLEAADVELLEEWAELRDEISNLKRQESALKGHFIDVVGQYKGSGIDYKNAKYYRKGGIDIERLMYDHPEIDFEQYRKPDSSYYRQTIKVKKGSEDIEI